MDVAVLGMGRMGQAVARRLAGAGLQVRVWNRSPGRTQEAEAAGATDAGSVAEAVAGAAVVVTSLADDEAVRAVVLGPGGVCDSLDPGAVLVEASTISPALSAELAAAVPRFAQMPIAGSPAAVEGGAASYLLGAAADVADAVVPVTDALGGNVRRLPAPELASTAKVVNNLLLLAGIATLAEAFAVGRAGGLDDEQLGALFGESPLVAAALRNRFEALLTGGSDGWFTTTLAAKDAGLAVELADRDLPIVRAVADRYRAAADSGQADADMVAVGLLYR